MKCKTCLLAVAAMMLHAAQAESFSLDGEWKLEYWDQPLSGPVRTLPPPAGQRGQ